MKVHSPLASALALAAFGLILSSCDSSPSATASLGSDASGSLAFSLPAATRAQVGTGADSLKVELHQGSLVHTATAALDSSIRVDGLEPGRWSLQVGVYSVEGLLHWYGTDSVTVVPGETTRADVTLRKARGSVDVVIHLEDNAVVSTDSLLGQWYLLFVDSTFPGRSVPLRFGDTGNISGSDGCNAISGSWVATDSTLRIRGFLQTLIACEETSTGMFVGLDSRVQSALLSTRAWKVASGMLYLSDSTGRVRLRYGRNEPNIMIPPVAPPIDTTVLVDSVADTAGLRLSTITLVSVEARDSFALLTLQLPHPNLKIRLIPLPLPSANCLSRPVAPDSTGAIPLVCILPSSGRILLVAGAETDPPQADVQVVETVRVAVPWSSAGVLAYFADRLGNSFQVSQPGVPIK